MHQNGNSQSKDSHSQTRKSISKFKGHNLFASFVNHQLKNQHPKVNNIPNTITKVLVKSMPEKKGAMTNPAKNTWPALSKILAKRSNSSFESEMFMQHQSNTKTASWQTYNFWKYLLAVISLE